MNVKEFRQIILDEFYIFQLLTTMISHPNIFDDSLLDKLAFIIRCIFYQGKQIDAKGKEFVKTMLCHQKDEFCELGLVALYCIALGLTETANRKNIEIFYDNQILEVLMDFIRPNSRNSQNNNSETLKKVI